MNKSRYSKKFGTPNPNLSQKKASTQMNNGIPLIHTQEQKQMAAMQLRLQLASNVLGHLAAVDFQHAIAKAVAAKDIAPGVADDENPNLMNINIAPVPTAQMAAMYADALLIGLGIVPAPQQVQQ